MRIISWNTNGLRATVKQGFFMPLFKKGKPDVLCLQETKAQPEQLIEKTRNVPEYFSYFSYSKIKKGYSGVAIYSKKKPREIFYGMGIKKFDYEGRIVGVKLKSFTIINVYFPNGGQGPHRLKYKLEFYDASPLILCMKARGKYLLGLNLNYLPIRQKQRLIKRLKNRYPKQWEKDKSFPNLNWHNIRTELENIKPELDRKSVV